MRLEFHKETEEQPEECGSGPTPSTLPKLPLVPRVVRRRGGNMGGTRFTTRCMSYARLGHMESPWSQKKSSASSATSAPV